jgi:hypothetical protein
MIIFGSRATNIGEFNVPQAECAHCHQRGTQRVAVFGRYAHIFWIPLFPIGKTVVSECTHCLRTLKKKEFSPELRRKYDEQAITVSRPFWHYVGLVAVLLFVGSSVIAAAFTTPDPREDLLDADLAALTTTPDMYGDSVAFELKYYFDEYILPEMEPENFKYHTRVDGDKVLFLLQVPKLKDLAKDARPELVDMVNELADEFPHLDGKERYIGIKGRSSMMLVRTPEGLENSSYADEEGLYDFYGNSVE